MAVIFKKNYFGSHQNRSFLILLLINFVVACVYYFSGSISHRPSRPTIPIETFSYQKQNLAIKFIRNILENEYDQQDLIRFYRTVENEFSLGLRCPKGTSSSPAMMASNLSNSTTRSLSPMNPIPLVRRSPRSKLYAYSINHSDACVNESLDLIVLIISKSDNYKTRDAIRRTWGSGTNLGSYSSINLKFFFLLDFDERLSTNIRLEYDLFHDIIQVELPEQYTLVTHRVIALFEWSFRYCRSAKFLFKTDDDIFINIILLLKFLSPLLTNTSVDDSFRPSDMKIYGYKHQQPPVFRHANDSVSARYVVTMDEYPCEEYPDYLSGFGYLIPKKARDAILYAAYRNPDRAFRISDVYLTGILPNYFSLARQHMSDYEICVQGDCEEFFNQPKSFAGATGLHHGDNVDVFQKINRFWQSVRKSI